MSVIGQPSHDMQAHKVTWRIQMTKMGRTKYMSHLDFIGTVERSARRAKLPIVLSGGFNPRFRISFSPALPVGISSQSEFVDFALREPVDIDEASSNLDKCFPTGMKVIASKILPPNRPALSAIIQAASYRLDFPRKTQEERDRVFRAIDAILERGSILVQRDTAKGARNVDIRPLIYELQRESSGSCESVYATVASGSGGNVRPFDLARVILEFQGIQDNEAFVNITREGLYTFCDGKLCLPW